MSTNNNHPHTESDLNEGKHNDHFILPTKTALLIGGALGVLTIVTVAVAQVDLGWANFPIAFLVATVKALLVSLFFMGLFYSDREDGVIFGTSFVFLAIFIVLTGIDLFWRGDVYVPGGPAGLAAQAPQGKPTLIRPWIAKPELVEAGKGLFAQQCASCHGATGLGDGTAAGTLTSVPRNFTQTAGWKNGRKPSQIFKTLREGLPGTGMASFATLSSDDRWRLVQYVSSLGPTQETDTDDDLAKVGLDPKSETGGGGVEAPTIPVAFALKRVAVEVTPQDCISQSLGTTDLAAVSQADRAYAERLCARTFVK